MLWQCSKLNCDHVDSIAYFISYERRSKSDIDRIQNIKSLKTGSSKIFDRKNWTVCKVSEATIFILTSVSIAPLHKSELTYMACFGTNAKHYDWGVSVTDPACTPHQLKGIESAVDSWICIWIGSKARKSEQAHSYPMQHQQLVFANVVHIRNFCHSFVHDSRFSDSPDSMSSLWWHNQWASGLV